MPLTLALSICGFAGWTLAYLLMIKRGFQDRTYGLPLPALTLNISWELVQTLLVPFAVNSYYKIFSPIWFGLFFILILDVVLNYQYLKFGIQYDLKNNINKAIYNFFPSRYLPYIGLLIVSLVVNIAFTAQFNYALGGYDVTANFSGILINVIDSILFIKMLIDRNNLDGQSLYIAFLKMLGTFASTLAVAYFFSSPLLFLCTITVFVLDWIYIVLVYNKAKSLGLNPFLRF